MTSEKTFGAANARLAKLKMTLDDPVFAEDIDVT